MKKVKEFIKKHKKGIAIATGLTGLAAVTFAVVKGKSGTIDLPTPEFDIGTMKELWVETQSNGETYINAIVDNLTIDDLGRFGEEMAKKVDGVDINSIASIIIGIKK